MFSSVAAVTLFAALVPQALATLYITSPVASTVCTGGTACPITWDDDGTVPTLATIGACTVALYVGDQFTQISLQSIGNVDVATQASFSFTPNPTVGGNSDLYFLRFTSVGYQVSGVPWEGFSAKFTLQGMSGQFNATESSLMYAPTTTLAGSSSTGNPTTSSPTSTTSATSQTIVTTTSAKASSTNGHTTSSPSPTTSKSGALPVIAGSSSTMVIGVAAVSLSAFFAAFAV